ncbi:hypothetical protein MMC17_009733 [Xylographa soralifera]|nr:hypothetical protein [Xylographa soralifera]
MPSLRLCLDPFFDNKETVQTIDVRMVFDVPQKHKDDTLFHHILVCGPVPTMQYTANDIRIQDSSLNIVPVYTKDTKDGREREFCLGKDLPAGDLIVQYQARPREVNELTRCGPQVALERDGGGLTGAGQAFLLRLASDEVSYEVTIEWNLLLAPPETRAVCTFGEGQKVSTRINPSVLDDCFFAVGLLKSYPAKPTGGQYAMFWLEDPPFAAAALGKQLEGLLPKVFAFFHDQLALYQVFLRRNVYRCTSGRGLYQGFVFAWTSIVPREEDGIMEFLFHEIVHNWPRLGVTTGGPGDIVDGWFTEGIAEYYSLILPYRFGIFTERDFVNHLNRRVSGYYTNPDRRLTNEEVPGRFWQGGHVNRIPYQRGFMYFMKLAYQLHHSQGRSLDQLIIEMVKLRLTGQPHGIRVWLDMIEAELGASAIDDYRDMSNAKLIILPPACLNPIIENDKWIIERQDQEEFFLGFPEDNLLTDPRIVKGLNLRSRAAEAGVREGDTVTQSFSFFYDAERWDKSFHMTVHRRDNDKNTCELVELSWWPRSWEKVESYVSVLR